MIHNYIIICKDPAFFQILVKWIKRMSGITEIHIKANGKAIRFQSENLYCIPHLIHFLKNHLTDQGKKCEA